MWRGPHRQADYTVTPDVILSPPENTPTTQGRCSRLCADPGGVCNDEGRLVTYVHILVEMPSLRLAPGSLFPASYVVIQPKDETASTPRLLACLLDLVVARAAQGTKSAMSAEALLALVVEYTFSSVEPSSVCVGANCAHI